MQQPPEKRTLGASLRRRKTGVTAATRDLPDLTLVPVPSMPVARSMGERRAESEGGALLVPAPAKLPVSLSAHAPAPPRHGRRWVHVLTFVTAIAMLAVVLAAGAHQSLAPASVVTTPPPTGRGPWTASAGAIAYIKAPPPKVPTNVSTPVWQAIQPCQSSYKFLPTISQWAVPPGCYANIYIPNPKNYVNRPGFGYCNWWVRVTHPNHPDITENWSNPHGTAPAAGAAVWFDGGEQGAESNGHWAVAVAVSPDRYWVLISEMNFAWRGAGFGKIDYRYIHVSPHVLFFYVYN
jgi:hypothetical protein